MDNNSIVNNQDNQIEQSGGGFWDLVKWLFVALAIALAAAGLILVFMYFFFYDFLTGLCKNQWIYGILSILPIVLEIVGLVLTVIVIGVPIMGVGMFLEVFTILCDFMRKEPGWPLDVGLGIFGLIPIIGLVGSVGKLGRRIFKFMKRGQKVL